MEHTKKCMYIIYLLFSIICKDNAYRNKNIETSIKNTKIIRRVIIIDIIETIQLRYTKRTKLC